MVGGNRPVGGAGITSEVFWCFLQLLLSIKNCVSIKLYFNSIA